MESLSLLTPQTFISHIAYARTLIVATIYSYITAADFWAFILIYVTLYLILSFIFLSIYNDKPIEQRDEERTLSGYYSEIDDIEQTSDDTTEEEEEKQIDLIDSIQILQPPKPTQFQINKMKQIRSKHADFFHSPNYLNLIPNDPNWINRPLKLKNATQKQHDAMLDAFVIPDEPFAYKSDIEDAIKLFNKWRKWKNGNEWKERTKKEDMTVYSHSIPNEPIDIIKGEGAIFPYSSPVVLGVLLNIFHRKQWDLKLDKLIKFKQCSLFSALVYCSVHTPTYFIADRDIVAITFVYAFEDGSCLIGSKSINHSDYPPDANDKVRATVNGDFMYLTPDFENNVQHTKVTLYSHLSLGGNLPNWLINQTSTEIPDRILKVRAYMKSVYGTLGEKGSLHVPPFPCLKMMGVDIGWMDPYKALEEDEEEKEGLFEYDNGCITDGADKVILLLQGLSLDIDTALDELCDLNRQM